MTRDLRAEASISIKLRLYIAGDTPAMLAALACREVLLRQTTGLEIAVIDIVEDPQTARSAGILAAPTLSYETEASLRRLVGDLGDPDDILKHFDLSGTGASS